MGWEIVKNAKKKDMTSSCYNFLKTIEPGSTVDYSTIKCDGFVSKGGSHYTEARLVQMLEEKGIGRPSTFSSLVDKIQERQYVKLTNVAGKKYDCDCYQISNGSKSESEKEIEHTVKECEVGAEKNKLVLQPLGLTVVEYLIDHFNELFDYEYTSRMEDDLEVVARGDKKWTDPCDVVLDTIETTISNLSPEDVKKIDIKIDDSHSYIMGKYGPVVKYVSPDEKDKKKATSFKPVKEGLDMEKIRSGELGLEDILQEEETEEDGWQYDGKAVKVKKGKYGLYVCWGDKNLALKGFGNRPPENLRQDDVFPILEKHKNGEYSSIVREISSDVSIRTGKTGSLYVFFKTSGMKKPKFIKMPKGITKSNLDEFTNDELIEKISL
tara:strand:+ start:590 stop:1732 length:1143 start_codon:yes stop_codon:yes gene_type:complete